MSTLRLASPAVACGLGLLVASAVTARAQSYGDDFWQSLLEPPREEQADWPRHFRIGALVGFNFKADFSLGGQFAVSGSNPGTPGRGTNHEYDDGYVRVDATGNSGGRTWNWGYQDAGQLVGNRLYFHSARAFSASGSAIKDGGAQVGFDSAYGGRLGRLWGGKLGWELGFGLLPTKISDNQPLAANVIRTVHSYDVSGLILPSPPYEGGVNGPSVLIDDNAVAEPDDLVVGASLAGSRTLDVMLYNFRLGPTLHWELHPRFAVAVSAGGALGIVTGDLEFDETLVLPDGSAARNQGKAGSTEFVYGAYVAGTLMYHAVKNGDIYVSFQYMPLSSARFSGGGREAELDMTGGLYFSAGINWPF